MLLLLLHHILQSCSVVLLIDNKFAGVNGRPVHFCTEILRLRCVQKTPFRNGTLRLAPWALSGAQRSSGRLVSLFLSFSLSLLALLHLKFWPSWPSLLIADYRVYSAAK